MRPLLVTLVEMIILQKCGRTTFSSCTIQCHVIMMLKWLKICYLVSTMSDQKLGVCLADVANAINKQKKGNVQDLMVFTMRHICMGELD